MHLLIEHGTWIIVPVVIVLGFIYLHVYPKVYPLLIARRLDEEDGRLPSAPLKAEQSVRSGRPGTFKTPTAVKSRP